jgi:hypothetical protein
VIDISAWGSFVGSVGFPIAIATYLVIYQSKEIKKVGSEIAKCRILLALILRELGVDATKEMIGDESGRGL